MRRPAIEGQVGGGDGDAVARGRHDRDVAGLGPDEPGEEPAGAFALGEEVGRAHAPGPALAAQPGLARGDRGLGQGGHVGGVEVGDLARDVEEVAAGRKEGQGGVSGRSGEEAETVLARRRPGRVNSAAPRPATRERAHGQRPDDRLRPRRRADRLEPAPPLPQDADRRGGDRALSRARSAARPGISRWTRAAPSPRAWPSWSPSIPSSGS